MKPLSLAIYPMNSLGRTAVSSRSYISEEADGAGTNFQSLNLDMPVSHQACLLLIAHQARSAPKGHSCIRGPPYVAYLLKAG